MGTRMDQNSVSLPSPLSAGPGPIKSTPLSSRRHRYSSEYHDYAARRQMHHQQQQQQQQSQDSIQGLYEHEHLQQRQQDTTPLDPPMTHIHRLPSPTSPAFFSGRRFSQERQQHQQYQQRQQSSVDSMLSPFIVSAKPFPPLLKVPFPNLTLTLALIYVDRLKAKYPEAKGEAGCSHRLFLVAYILAAKYRCSVELAALLQEHNNHIIDREVQELERLADDDGSDNSSDNTMSRRNSTNVNNDLTEQRLWEARSRAELIFSNHEWVRLLSLGSFFRPPSTPQASPTSPSSAVAGETGVGIAAKLSLNAAASARISPTQPMHVQAHPSTSTLSPSSGDFKPEPKPLPIQSTPLPIASTTSAFVSSDTTKNTPAPTSKVASKPAALPQSAPITWTSSILQVEDLDRMEAEFLTFLDFDLSTKSPDLDTCWSLLVGSKEI
ncbi:hypothetical protein EDD11_005656 [Mortierella claussenii]|nr:hypothetical protein EDD11_005656 [Mortierella claussenii]